MYFFHPSSTHTYRTKRGGFTLIEIIVGVGIFTMILGAIILFQQTVIWSTKAAQTNLTIHSQVRRTLASFSTELRTARPSASGAYAIEAAGTSSVVFYSNIDKVSDVERVRYFLATSTLGGRYDVVKKGVTKPVGTAYPTSTTEVVTIVVTSVRNSSSLPLFAYFDRNYAGTSTALSLPINISAVRHAQMNLVVEELIGRATTSRAYTTHTSIRNLKDNY